MEAPVWLTLLNPMKMMMFVSETHMDCSDFGENQKLREGEDWMAR